MEEIWKDIVWYEWLYQVSNIWRIKALRFDKTKILKLSHNRYLEITLRINGKSKKHLIHRLVAKSFIPNPENRPQINHKNWIKTDNRVENLEWCTAKENMAHLFNVLWHKTLFQKEHPKPMEWRFWKDNPTSRKVIQYDKELNFIKIWYSMADATRELWIGHNNISACCRWVRNHLTAWWYIWKYA